MCVPCAWLLSCVLFPTNSYSLSRIPFRQRSANSPNSSSMPAGQGQGKEVAETMSLWRTLSSNWTQLKARKLQQWGRMIRGPQNAGMGGSEERNAAEEEEEKETEKEEIEEEEETVLPPWLQSLSQELVRVGIFPPQEAPNHVLVNEYKPQGGILHHTDGPFYQPNVAILSIGGPVLLTFRRRITTDQLAGRGSWKMGPKDLYSVLLQPNSLLVFRETLYSDYLHGIADGSYFETIDAESAPEREGGVTATDADTDTSNACIGKEREKELQRHDMTCICLNKAAAGVTAGQRVERLNRTSLTFRRVRAH